MKLSKITFFTYRPLPLLSLVAISMPLLAFALPLIMILSLDRTAFRIQMLLVRLLLIWHAIAA
jgi:hypothetical protein